MSKAKNESADPKFENVLCQRWPLAVITINRPEKHNAISLATLDDLHGAVDAAALDESVRVITITGAGGKAFAAGSDLSEVIDRDFRKALEPIVRGSLKNSSVLSQLLLRLTAFVWAAGLKSPWAATCGCDASK